MRWKRPLTAHIRPGEDPLDIDAYESAGGYQALRKALHSMAPADVVQAVDDAQSCAAAVEPAFPPAASGASCPWARTSPHPKYLVINADEMEPGTFKDRLLLEGDPHQLIEGIIIAAYAIQADIAYIFLRQEYHPAARAAEPGHR